MFRRLEADHVHAPPSGLVDTLHWQISVKSGDGPDA
jgi:hypothetical protein